MRAVSVRSFCDARTLVGSVGLIAIAVSLCAPGRLVMSTFLPTIVNGAPTPAPRVGAELRTGTVLCAERATAAIPPNPMGAAAKVATASAPAPRTRQVKPFLIRSPLSGFVGRPNLIGSVPFSQMRHTGEV